MGQRRALRPLLTLALAVISAVAVLVGFGAAGSAETGKGRGETPPWAGKPADAVDKGQVISKMRHMSLQEKVGQMFVPYVYGESADTQDPAMVEANQGLYGADNAEGVIEKYKPGGIIYFSWSNNVNDPAQIAGLSNGIQEAAMDQPAEVPMLISTDQEQGVVIRVDEPATQFPGNMALGATRDAGHAEKAAAITGEELGAMGINQNFAPVADVNVNPENPVIGVRSFGSDPGLVSKLARAQVEGYQGTNTASTVKHFPGHGDTDVDSHLGLPVIDKSRSELEEEDLPPFEEAIDAGVDSIMTAHIVVPALDDSNDSGRPATLSEPILTGLLREEMGYEGLIVTDALGMDAISEEFGDDRAPVEAIKAGADQMLMPPDMDVAYESVLEAVESGEIPEKRIDESVYRILELKAERGLFENPYVQEKAVGETVGAPEHRAAAGETADDATTLVKNEAGTLPLARDAGQEALVTGAGGISGSQADSQDESTLGSLAAAIESFGASASVYESGASPGAEEREEAVERARRSDLVVVTTNKAWDSESQQRLVEELRQTGTPVVVAAVRDPYDIAHFPQAETYLATYGYRPVSMQSLARVMFGEIEPEGRLPVSIPSADNPDETLYPYGHGLGYGGEE